VTTLRVYHENLLVAVEEHIEGPVARLRHGI
jgi:hypothetical protein